MSSFYILSNINLCVILASFLIALWCYNADKTDIDFKLVFTILFLTLFVEGLTTVAIYTIHLTGIDNVLLLYNIYYAAVYILWFIVFNRIVTGKIRKVIPFFILLYVIAFFVEAVFFLDYFVVNKTYPHIIGSLCMTVTIVFYFIEILQDGSFKALKDNLYFWISCGLLIYYLGTLPFRIVNNFFTFSSEAISGLFDYSFFNFQFVLTIIMHVVFCVGLYRYKISLS